MTIFNIDDSTTWPDIDLPIILRVNGQEIINGRLVIDNGYDLPYLIDVDKSILASNTNPSYHEVDHDRDSIEWWPYTILHDSYALALVQAERLAQDKEWGGPETDDTRTIEDWLRFIAKKHSQSLQADLDGHSPTAAYRLVQVAALAIAALESMERKK